MRATTVVAEPTLQPRAQVGRLREAETPRGSPNPRTRLNGTLMTLQSRWTRRWRRCLDVTEESARSHWRNGGAQRASSQQVLLCLILYLIANARRTSASLPNNRR